MSTATITRLIDTVYQHCLEHDLSEFTFVFHGGEPLLASQDLFRFFVYTANSVLLPLVKPRFKMQTNGMLITESWCELFEELNIGIGISLDGDQKENDKHRIDHKGNGSFEAVIKGYRLASSKLTNKPGIVTFINIGTDALYTYNFLKSIDIEYVDFILPDATHNSPKWTALFESPTPYADWLIKVFDMWFFEKGKKPKIRFFETILLLLLGRSNDDGNDAMGDGNHQVLVIETDGGIEPIDSLKVCGESFTKINANVMRDQIGDAFNRELAEICNLSHKMLCKQCMVCPVRSVCGGGYLAHRFSTDNGFDNPSIYCKDLMKLITHIQNVVLKEIPPPILEEIGLVPVHFEQAQEIVARRLKNYNETDWSTYLRKFSTKKTENVY